MKIGDILIIEEDNMERLKWSLARVIKLFYGEDGCREVSTVENEGQHSPQTCCKTMCIRRDNVNNIFCEL